MYKYMRKLVRSHDILHVYFCPPFLMDNSTNSQVIYVERKLEKDKETCELTVMGYTTVSCDPHICITRSCT